MNAKEKLAAHHGRPYTPDMLRMPTPFGLLGPADYAELAEDADGEERDTLREKAGLADAPPTSLPPVDLQDNVQNAFVQNYLSALMAELVRDQGFYDKSTDAIELVIELVQETYGEDA